MSGGEADKSAVTTAWELSEQERRRHAAIYAASQLIAGVKLGLTAQGSWIEANASEGQRASGTNFFGGQDAALYAVWLLAGPIGLVRWQQEEGYSNPEFTAWAWDVRARDDMERLARIRRDHQIASGPAEFRAGAMLGDARVWQAVRGVATLLLDKLVLDGREAQAAAVHALAQAGRR
jgi:hypothetical protein